MFDGAPTGLLVDRMGQHQESFARFMNDKASQTVAREQLLHQVYARITNDTAGCPRGGAEIPVLKAGFLAS